MTTTPCILGLDVSTTASKALCIDSEGTILGIASNEHPLSSPHPMWSEQNPETWWDTMVQSIRSLVEMPSIDPEAIEAIGLTGQMHGLVLLDSHGNVIRPAMLWNDGRSGDQCDRIRTQIGHQALVSITGNDAFTGFTAPKLLWVQDHEPSCYAKISQILLPKDYIRWQLSDVYATDRAGAGGTLLLDISTRNWAAHLLSTLDISQEWLPPTYEGTECTGQVSHACASMTGLMEGTPIFAGGGDQAAQAIGVGAMDPDTWAVTLGTSGVVFAPCNHPSIEPMGRAHAFPHAIPNTWHMMGVMLSAAGSLQWYKDTFAGNIPMDQLLQETSDIQPGSDGLFFSPYLTGERTPHADPMVRGSFTGLTSRHTRGHITRAVLEGVGYGLKDNLQLLYQVGLPAPKRIRISGGGAQSSLWVQMLADIMGTPLEIVKATEGAAVGAALLAGTGAGIWGSMDDACGQVISVEGQCDPSESSVLYEGFHSKFGELYSCLKGFYHS